MAEGRVAAGVHVVPLMPAEHVIALAVEAERLGYTYLLVADEGLHPDIYVVLGAAARETETITIGVMTNGFTRHPGVTANAVATLNELAPGRVVATILAGGSMVLTPLGIPRERPFRVMADTIATMRALWTGDEVTRSAHVGSLDRARLGSGHHDIEIWVAGRGPMVLGLAGREADGVILTVKPDLAAAIGLVNEAPGGRGPKPMYLGRICYTPEMLEAQRLTLPYVLMDSPPRALQSLGLDEDAIAVIQDAASRGDVSQVQELADDDLLRRYQIAGTPAECAAEVDHLVAAHGLHAIHIDALSADLDENLSIIEASYAIISGAAA